MSGLVRLQWISCALREDHFDRLNFLKVKDGKHPYIKPTKSQKKGFCCDLVGSLADKVVSTIARSAMSHLNLHLYSLKALIKASTLFTYLPVISGRINVYSKYVSKS